MGCNGSKATKTADQKNEPGKTLLATESAAEAEAKSPEKKGKGTEVALKVTIASARALRNADFAVAGNKSDPYCTCEVAGKPDSKIQTPTIDDQLNPSWMFESALAGYSIGDSLTFVVKDQDPVKPDDILGKATVTAEQIFPEGFDGEVQLTEAGSGVEAFLKLKVEVIHPIAKVKVVGAKDLRNADWVGKSDPYCHVEVTGRPEVCFDTPSVTDNLNPQWNHEAEVVGYRAGESLTFTVKDSDPVKPDDILGKVDVPLEAFAEKAFEGELQLTETQNGLVSLVILKIELAAPVPPADAADDKAEVAPEASAAAESAPAAAPAEVLVEEQPGQGKMCSC